MKQFPVEILKQIFPLLHQQQKLECMLVCRHWANIINNTCLLNNVLITNKESFKTLIERLQQSPSQGAQVKRLIVYSEIENETLLRLFPILFPNMTSFYRFSRGARHPKILMQNWDNHIEQFYDKYTKLLFHHILRSNKCHHLKTLSIRGHDVPDDALINSLKNAPNLSDISLDDCFMTVERLERLHTTLPLLESVRFLYCQLDPFDETMEIEPAARVTRARIYEESGDCHQLCSLLSYARKKYTNLTEFVCHAETRKDFPTLFEQEKPSPEKIKMVTDSLMSFIAGLGPQLQKIKIIFQQFDSDHLKSIANAPYQISHFKLKSKKVDHRKMKNFLSLPPFQQLQSLDLYHLKDTDFLWLKEMSSLRNLKIKLPKSRDINIKSILDYCKNSLESLFFELCTLISSPSQYTYALKSLKFRSVSFPKDIDAFISKSCPQLKSLGFQHCIFDTPNFYLPDSHLTSFKMIKTNLKKGESHYILVSTQKERRWWHLVSNQATHQGFHVFDNNDQHAFPLSKTFPYDTLTCEPYMTFTFASVIHIDTATK